jgi:2-iminobutanoate/2-iminopropanoate deaminase
MKTARNPGNVHPPIAGYTHQIEISAPERMLVLSGQVGRTEAGLVPEDPIQQLDLAFENLFRNLQAAGMEVKDIIKLTLYLTGEMDAAARRDVLVSRLGDHKPCMTLVFVAALASPIYRVEVDAWASQSLPA